MKQILIIVCLMSQTAFAKDIEKLGEDLGKVYRKAIETEVSTSAQEELKKQISNSLAASYLKITLLPLHEIKLKLEAADALKASDNLPTLAECREFQLLYQDYEANLLEVERKLSEVFYSTSPYRVELQAFQDLKVPMQVYFSSAINMEEGINTLDLMLAELSSLGLRWQRKAISNGVRFEFDHNYFQRTYQVSSPEQLADKSKLLKQLLQGPVKKMNYLKSVQTFISQRFGMEEFEASLKELAGKLKSLGR